MADAVIAALKEQEATARESVRSLERKIADTRSKLADFEAQCAAACARANDFANAITRLTQES